MTEPTSELAREYLHGAGSYALALHRFIETAALPGDEGWQLSLNDLIAARHALLHTAAMVDEVARR